MDDKITLTLTQAQAKALYKIIELEDLTEEDNRLLCEIRDLIDPLIKFED